MNFFNAISNMFGGGSSRTDTVHPGQAQQIPALQAQSAPAPARLQNPNYNRNIATDLSQAPTQGQATQAPQGQGTEQQITKLFTNLLQFAPERALNLLMALMGPFMEMMNGQPSGQPSAQPAAQASPTPQASAQTSPDLNQILNLIGQANPTPAQTSAPTEQNPQQNLESILQAGLSSEQPAPAAAPTVQLDTQAKAKPSETAPSTLAA
jgi:hypothetical protein